MMRCPPEGYADKVWAQASAVMAEGDGRRNPGTMSQRARDKGLGVKQSCSARGGRHRIASQQDGKATQWMQPPQVFRGKPGGWNSEGKGEKEACNKTGKERYECQIKRVDQRRHDCGAGTRQPRWNYNERGAQCRLPSPMLLPCYAVFSGISPEKHWGKKLYHNCNSKSMGKLYRLSRPIPWEERRQWNHQKDTNPFTQWQ